MALTVHIVDPEATLWHGETASVSVPAADGDLGILPGRQPVLAVLRPGTVHISGDRGGSGESIAIPGGFVSVDDDTVTIVVDSHDEKRADSAAGGD